MVWTLNKIGDIYEFVFFKRTEFNIVKKPAERFPSWYVKDVEVNDIVERIDERASASISRTKRRIREVALCNKFDYFVTLTLDKAKVNDRSDYIGNWKKIAEWIHNINRGRKNKIEYLAVPELHKDNINWHYHALIRGLDKSEISEINGRKNWLAYYDKFGYSEISKIKNRGKCATYISKYITKGIENNTLNPCKKMYFCTHGLNRSEELAREYSNKNFEYVKSLDGLDNWNNYDCDYVYKLSTNDESEMQRLFEHMSE